MNMTKNDYILIAAKRLEKEGHSPFTEVQLLLKAWGLCKEKFGLSGHEESYPDNNSTRCQIVGKIGLVALGLLDKSSPGEYRTTQLGRDWAAKAEADIHTTRISGFVKKTKITARQDALLQRLLNSTARRYYISMHRDDLTFRDACVFWEADRTDVDDIHYSIKLMGKELATIDSRIHADVILKCGRIVPLGSVKKLIECHEFMVEKFEKHIAQKPVHS